MGDDLRMQVTVLFARKPGHRVEEDLGYTVSTSRAFWPYGLEPVGEIILPMP